MLSITPSVEIANKIAKALGVSLDYLVGNTELELNDKLMNRIKEVTKMTEKDKDHVFTLLDAFIARTKLQESLMIFCAPMKILYKGRIYCTAVPAH